MTYTWTSCSLFIFRSPTVYARIFTVWTTSTALSCLCVWERKITSLVKINKLSSLVEIQEGHENDSIHLSSSFSYTLLCSPCSILWTWYISTAIWWVVIKFCKDTEGHGILLTLVVPCLFLDGLRWWDICDRLGMSSNNFIDLVSSSAVIIFGSWISIHISML